MLKHFAIALSAIFPVLLAAGPAMAQDACADGTPATVNGTIRNQFYNGKEWHMLVSSTSACGVELMGGMGKLPANCQNGHAFTANGNIFFWGGQNQFTVHSISCD